MVNSPAFVAPVNGSIRKHSVALDRISRDSTAKRGDWLGCATRPVRPESH